MPRRSRLPHALSAVLFAALCLTAAASAVLLAARPLDYLYEHVVVDDAIYYVQPARNLLQGNGYSFDGVHRTNGVQPLWAAVVLLLTAVLPDAATTVRAMVLLGGLTWVAAAGLLYALLARLGPIAGLVGGTLLLLAGFERRLAMWGMEAGLHCLLLVLTIALGCRVVHTAHAARPRALRWLGIVAALLSLTRVEYGLLAILLGQWLMVAAKRGRDWRAAGAALVAYALPPVVIGGAWLLFSRTYFGEWTPISGTVKLWTSTTAPMPLADGFAAMLQTTLLRAFLAALLASSWVFAMLCERLPTPAEAHWTLALALAPLSLGAAALWRRLRGDGPFRTLDLGVALGTFTLIHFAMLVFVMAWFAGYCGWYFTGETVVLCLACGSLAGALRGALRLAALPSLALVGVAVALAVPFWFDYPPTWVTSAMVREGRLVQRWLPPGSTIGSLGSGYVALLNPERRVVNLDGLINDGRYFRDYLRPDRVPDYYRDERIGYCVDHLPPAGWRALLQREPSLLPRLPERVRTIACQPEAGGVVVCLLATEHGDPAVPAVPAHPLGEVRLQAFVHGTWPVVDDAESAARPAGHVLVGTVQVPPDQVLHVAVPSEHLAAVVDAAGLAKLEPGALRVPGLVSLAAVDPPLDPVVPGQRLVVTTYWQALPGLEAAAPPRLRVQVGPATVDSEPAHGTLGRGQWREGTILPHGSVLRLPADLPPGDYPITVTVIGPDGSTLGAMSTTTSRVRVIAR